MKPVEILVGSEVGSAKRLACSACAQRFDQADSLFNCLAGLCQIAVRLLCSRDSQQAIGFSPAVAYRPPDLQGFIELLHSQQGVGFSPAVAYCPADLQGFIELLRSLLSLPQ